MPSHLSDTAALAELVVTEGMKTSKDKNRVTEVRELKNLFNYFSPLSITSWSPNTHLKI